MTQLIRCRIEDEIGQVSECILSMNEFLDLVADKLGLRSPDYDLQTARLFALFFIGPIHKERYEIDDWVIEWKL